MDETNQVATAAAAAEVRNRSGARTMLWILLLVYIFNFLDRQIVNILAEPIARDLSLSDTQIGLMTGLAFALFYTVLGIPIARFADRPTTNRVGLISISLATWAGMTVLCGMAHNFIQLLLARIGVGIGEAGCTPAAHSLISSTVEPSKRSSAIAFYGLGIPIGTLFGLAIGGFANDLWGWRFAFMLVGAPGILMAMALPFLIRDERRRPAAAPPAPGADLTVVGALREVFGTRTFLHLAIGASFTAFLTYGKNVWALILFQRSHGLSVGETGLLLGIAIGAAGIVGTWLGGYMADRFGRVDKRHMLTTPVIGMALGAPILFLGYWIDEWHIALVLIFIPTVFNASYYGPTFACLHGLVRPEARAMASAILLFMQNLVGLGLGPLLFGILSEMLKPAVGTESVRYVLYGAAWLGLIPAFFLWRASLRLNSELKSG
ncbi:spinster family MFS transporter [Sphingobium indicum]|uniref:MFS transporter n=1 Tax=Sphingobium indicum (strain DSM 16412 / CCM 7286 / MTCC 6364 / B90A) TaxID=861109 RepID=A0A1L5BL47_SPHIB|nr:MFS transporter [Sphingobium indicum]APL93593.1 MFS transporter [Sphingobium indicum B90A]NYI21806.1 putative MFS family arabinose efflux permease [Sphingobium indicum]